MTKLERFSRVKWGDDWRAALATAAQRDRRTVYRWLTGRTAVPAWIWMLFDKP